MTLAPVFLDLIFKTGSPLFNFGFTVIAILATFILNNLLKGIWKSTTIIFTVVLGTAAYYLFNEIPPMPDYDYRITLDSLFIRPEFEAGTILSFLICFFALLINELGSVQSVKDMVQADEPDKRIARGNAVVGLGNTLSGMLGIIGPVDFSISPGIIASTGCASRYTIIPCGIGLVLCALSPSMVSVFTLLPDIIIGIMLMYIVILQLAAAFNLIVDTGSVRNFDHALTIAIPMGIGLFVALLPQSAVAALPAILQPILSNGFVVGVLTVVMLEHLVFKKRQR